MDAPQSMLIQHSDNGLSLNTSNSTNNNIPKYYQVATPNSPHEEFNDDSMLIHPREESAKESEDVERLKYETAKSELLDKLNLHILINHKKIRSIEDEIGRIDSQLKLVETLHDDTDLLDKIEKNKLKKIELQKARSSSFMSFYPSSTSNNENLPISASSNIPQHHYQTRSKSTTNTFELTQDDSVLGKRSKNPSKGKLTISNPNAFQVQEFKPNQMNAHHRRTYSTSCLSNNSGIIGQTENNEPIFRRFDGVLVVIMCSMCTRSGFTSAQGMVNHARLKHHKTYSSQPLAVLNNQVLLPLEKQDSTVLDKFKKLGLDPQKDYLPYNVAIPSMECKKKDYQKIRSTEHLQKMYENKSEFIDLMDMVDTTQNDLDIVLAQSSGEEDEVEEAGDPDDTEGSYKPSDFNSNSASSSSSNSDLESENHSEGETPRTNVDEKKVLRNKKRKIIHDDEEEEEEEETIGLRLRKSAKPKPESEKPKQYFLRSKFSG
ncbi:hypothetical protein KAFR_0C05810 [Kazachstania africana CBS 2517]|uniref:Protein AHC1 n=1 Tax=Kazachstania africana (strain ATCC 22294 / BCRC 22015 / CBS 2517 / CECT 1963 / NBRC 1671 / NRRL Y-8276) TaxID=1071382 RepID=H2AT72_KAZAF|nr:hypothetical protein KAFR_0C05810 [Kazachstania africana CBS 2517]CCF57572.1 hypothetical protein KAFR_0C05810 [Kazachstania africana CBS 2517]